MRFRSDFSRIIRLIESGQIDTKPWITHRVPFAQLIAGISQLVEARDRRDQGDR